MRRTLLALATLAIGTPARANAKLRHIACLASPPANTSSLPTFRAAFDRADAQLAEGVRFTEEHANFDAVRLRQLAAKLNEQRPDLILSFDFDAAQAVFATRGASSVPLVFRAHDDPLRAV